MRETSTHGVGWYATGSGRVNRRDAGNSPSNAADVFDALRFARWTRKKRDDCPLDAVASG